MRDVCLRRLLGNLCAPSRVAADGLTGRARAGRAEYAVTEHLRMSGIYWGLTAMHLMSAVHEMKAEEIVEWLVQCQHPSGEA